MQAGRLDRRVTILVKIADRDAKGGAVETWIEKGSVWARRADQGGREFRQAGTLNAEASAIFEIRYFDGLTPADRIRDGATDFDIVNVSEIGRRDGMLVQVKARAA